MESTTVWTAGFFNERFPQPVSPLGWSIIAPLVEKIAFRDPLSYLGCRNLSKWHILRLYNGHPYVNMTVFQTLYKVFPEALLPEDAARYFPGGNTGLRKQAHYPRCLLDPRFLISIGLALLRDPGNWSPWHNYRKWEDFQHRHAAAMAQIAAQIASPMATKDEAGAKDKGLQRWFALLEQLHYWDEQLLRLHRWSLTHADILYTLLRRLLAAWVDRREATALATALVGGVTNRSLEVDAALRHLAALARDNSTVYKAITCGDLSLLQDEPSDKDFLNALHDFLAAHGHRSFSLDIFHPTFRDDPSQVLSLSRSLITTQGNGAGSNSKDSSNESPSTKEAETQRKDAPNGIEDLGIASPVKRAVLKMVLSLARRYLPLREDQRYSWQKSLALQRQIYLSIGRFLAARGLLQAPEDIFFLTAEEVKKAASLVPDRNLKALAEQRKMEFERLLADWQRDPHGHYPSFLLGDRPFPEDSRGRTIPIQERVSAQGDPLPSGVGPEAGEVFHGLPISPGVAKGPAKVIYSPAGLGRIKEGDILVVPSTDPGWTPIFPLLGGLVMERGGQLSHGAVVAREYRLPAVSGVTGMTSIVRDGEPLLVDGNVGIVTRLRPGQVGNG